MGEITARSIMFEIYQLQGLQRLIRLCRSTQSAQQMTFWTHVYDITMLYAIYHDIQYIHYFKMETFPIYIAREMSCRLQSHYSSSLQM